MLWERIYLWTCLIGGGVTLLGMVWYEWRQESRQNDGIEPPTEGEKANRDTP